MKGMLRTTALGGAMVFMAASAQAMDMKDGFMVGDTKIKIGGYVDLDIHMTEYTSGSTPANRIDRDMYILSLTPTGNGEGSEYFDFSAETSRLSFTAKNGGTTGYIEVDFLGRNANERVSNSHGLRIRRAFIKTGNVLMGQEWTTFQNLSAIPESASFLTASEGQIFVRQQMVRWTNGPLQIALENPGESRIGSTAGQDNAERPDVIVRYNHKADFGNISVSGMSRQISDGGNFDEDGISFNIAGRVKAGPGDVRFTYASGEGMGRYIGLHAAFEAANVGGQMELLESAGYVLAYRLPVGDMKMGGRFNVGFSSLEVDEVDAGLETVSSTYAAYLWSPKPKLTYGVEYLQGTRENADGSEGDIDRLTFSAKFAF